MGRHRTYAATALDRRWEYRAIQWAEQDDRLRSTKVTKDAFRSLVDLNVADLQTALGEVIFCLSIGIVFPETHSQISSFLSSKCHWISVAGTMLINESKQSFIGSYAVN
jgi:hypothetical protein